MPWVKCILSVKPHDIDPSAIVIFDYMMWAATFAAWTLGSVLMFGIIHYERFGGDSQKRSLGNRLISSSAKCLVAFSFCLQLVIILFRYDLSNAFVYISLIRCYMVFSVAAILFVEVFVALRYLQIFVWGCVKEINEELAMKVIGRSILLVSVGLGFTLNMNLPLYTVVLAFSKDELIEVEVPKQFCLPEHFDPMNNR